MVLGNVIGSNIFNICMVLGVPVALFGGISASNFKNLDQMDSVREEINEAIKHINYKKWLNVSFTGDKKWAI